MRVEPSARRAMTVPRATTEQSAVANAKACAWARVRRRRVK
jgi:hypothetical protein